MATRREPGREEAHEQKCPLVNSARWSGGVARDAIQPDLLGQQVLERVDHEGAHLQPWDLPLRLSTLNGAAWPQRELGRGEGQCSPSAHERETEEEEGVRWGVGMESYGPAASWALGKRGHCAGSLRVSSHIGLGRVRESSRKLKGSHPVGPRGEKELGSED